MGWFGVGELFKLGHTATVRGAFDRCVYGGALPVVFSFGNAFRTVVAVVKREVFHFADDGADRFDKDLELFFVVGCIGDESSDDEHGAHFDDCLKVVALLKASSTFHDATFGIGKVVLVFGSGAGFGWFGRFAPGFASGFLFLGFSFGELLFMLGEFFFEADFGALVEDCFGFLELGEAVLAASDFHPGW